MIVPMRIYKNSFLASVVSIVGSAILVGGIAGLFVEPVTGICCIAAGIGLLAWGKNISDNKAFKKWWKQITDNHLEPQIAASQQTAIAIYNKNPQERTLKEIAKLNPAAAQNIRAQLEAKKQQNKKK